MIRRVLLPILVVASLIVTSAAALASEKNRAEAELASIGNSGISAEIRFVDNPEAHTLTIKGRAEGLDPTKKYFSLLYNVGSPSVGPMACEPTNGSLSFIDMLVGFWSVNRHGEGRLLAVKSANGNSNLIENLELLRQFGIPNPEALAHAPQYVGLNRVGNMSVRNATAGFQLVACGDILRDD